MAREAEKARAGLDKLNDAVDRAVVRDGVRLARARPAGLVGRPPPQPRSHRCPSTSPAEWAPRRLPRTSHPAAQAINESRAKDISDVVARYNAREDKKAEEAAAR